jgi:hypothetical protein
MTSLPSRTSRRARTALVALLAAGALGAAAAAVFAPTGCSSNCNEPCGPGQVYIGSVDGRMQLPITGIALFGPACPPYGVSCIGPPDIGGCSYFTVTGLHPGACDVGIAFSDRPAELVHLQFGESRTCCPGYPVVGESTFIVPTNPDAGIAGVDSGADAVTIIVDGGTDGAAD